MFGQPGDEEIQSALPALRPDLRAPVGSAFHELAEAQQPHDLSVGRVLDQAHGRPCPVEVAERENLLLEKLRFMTRLAKDLHYLDLRRHEFVARSLDEIGRLVGGWMKASRAAEAP
jgi:hypothetical protein